MKKVSIKRDLHKQVGAKVELNAPWHEGKFECVNSKTDGTFRFLTRLEMICLDLIFVQMCKQVPACTRLNAS